MQREARLKDHEKERERRRLIHGLARWRTFVTTVKRLHYFRLNADEEMRVN